MTRTPAKLAGEMPLAAFDLETTGPDPHNARIVTANLTTITPNPHGGWDAAGRNWLLNPEVDIPEGAQAVHGITTEYAREHGQNYADGLDEITRAVAAVWESGYALVAYNASFDVTLLHVEAQRALGRGVPIGGLILDPFVIDKAFDQFRKGSRKLGEVCAVYGLTLDNAHVAEADALAAARLAWVMLRRYNLGDCTTEQLMREQTLWYADQRDSLARFWKKKARAVEADDPVTAEELLARVARLGREWPISTAPTTAKEPAA